MTDATPLRLNMTDTLNALTMTEMLSKKMPIYKLAVPLFKFKLFIFQKLINGSNVVALIPALRQKLNNLCSNYLEECENNNKLNENGYLITANMLKEEHENIEVLLDILEFGLVVKCEII
jgi:hypothetical protein